MSMDKTFDHLQPALPRARADGPALLRLAGAVQPRAVPGLRIHDDGTLTEEDRDRLRTAAPGGVSVRRPRGRRTRQMAERLEKYPVCLRLPARSQVMSLKLFDIALLEPGPMHYCDSATSCSLRPFDRLLRRRSRTRRPPLVLMRDRFNTYSGGWRRLLRPGTACRWPTASTPG